MHKALIFFCFLVLAISFNRHACMGQEAPVVVTRSNDKVVIGGTIYYIHLVRKGETLYSISRAYEVTQQDIIAENPGAQTGLQIDQALKIPFKNVQTTPPPIPSDQMLHEVEAGQTLFSISRLYSVGVDEIVSLNPGVDEVLRAGDTLRIPKKTISPVREGFPDEDKDFLYHKVEKGETLYSLSQKYNVPIREIRRANRILIFGLRTGEIIRIPKTEDFLAETDEEPEIDVHEEETDSLALLETEVFDEFSPVSECLLYDSLARGRHYHVALFLPLVLDRSFVSAEAGANPVIHSSAMPYLEFYEGVLVAIDSLKKKGLSLNLYVYDSERSIRKIRRILSGEEFSRMDLIIGPFFPDELRVVSEFSSERKIPLVTPLTTRREFLQSNPLLYQVTPSPQSELEKALSFASSFPVRNFVLVHRNDPLEANQVEQLKSILFRELAIDSGFHHVAIKEVFQADNLASNLEESFVKDEQNVVIVLSSNQAFIADVLNRLNILSMSYALTVFGLPDWQKFRNLEVDFYHRLQIHFLAPFFVDYQRPEVQNFLKAFRKRFATEPMDYGFLGFDVGYYFLSALQKFGPEFPRCLPYLHLGLTQSDFSFRKSSLGSGFENKGLSIIRYNSDYSVVRLPVQR
jgi:LysM repeat protein/ABC-type branched-subunit amino acid transport system substrate-binding protein